MVKAIPPMRPRLRLTNRFSAAAGAGARPAAEGVCRTSDGAVAPAASRCWAAPQPRYSARREPDLLNRTRSRGRRTLDRRGSRPARCLVLRRNARGFARKISASYRIACPTSHCAPQVLHPACRVRSSTSSTQNGSARATILVLCRDAVLPGPPRLAIHCVTSSRLSGIMPSRTWPATSSSP